ncbi:DUF4065 domain-containing protein [Tropicibacter sp. R16_0]|uniref:Panacea domain-containing protein n=1 Tax=Tropicibacter sp. R16_0 TaxID=2821102 RepID=UPI001AD9699E|nr:type II toxin-antitoxin system antitoxin SocA domain-containing protein [Tropicibacter sp. R16_0]MBO9453145.1 DUF4065 domain-containing protein [Tropicibacter sp. R16_0]
MYDARVVANEVLKSAWSKGYDVTQIDIQKICYFLSGHHLVEHGEPLISSAFEAWDYGPVQRSLYNAFKKFEDQPITEFATAFDPIRRTTKELPPIQSNTARETIERHLEKYLAIPSFELVEITHSDGTPWTMTRSTSKQSANIGMRISNEMIASHFEGLSVA